MARPQGTNVVKTMINAPSIEQSNKVKTKYQKNLVFDYEMKETLKIAAKELGMTEAGFIKFCIKKELKEMGM